jgi:Spy/CpxP family protein refolding chaperone
MLNRSKLAAASLILVTFVAGGAVGTLISDAWEEGEHPSEEGDRDREGRDGERERKPYSERLGDALDLTAAQRESVSVIMQRRQDGLRRIWAETRPRFDSLRLEIREEIKKQLNEEQKATFQEMIARSDSSRAAHEAREAEDRNRGNDNGRRYDL